MVLLFASVNVMPHYKFLTSFLVATTVIQQFAFVPSLCDRCDKLRYESPSIVFPDGYGLKMEVRQKQVRQGSDITNILAIRSHISHGIFFQRQAAFSVFCAPLPQLLILV